MARTMTASGMTNGQINTAVAQLRAAMEKHRSEIISDTAQQVLGVENLGMQMFAVFRKHAEMISKFIVRRVVKVNRNRPPHEALKATARNLYVTDSVVAAMPKGEGSETEVIFFKPGPEAYKNGWINDADLDNEYEKRGLKPADPYSLAAVNEVDPLFADEYPNSTHWKDADGKWCYTAFYRWDGGRSVDVYRDGFGWRDDWWFAGLRK